MGQLVPGGTTVDQINKAKGLAETVKKVEAVEYVGDVYKTIIRNNTPDERIVPDDNDKPWLFLPPEREITLCSWSPETRYAPYSRVVYEKDGRLNISRRFGFHDPAENAPFSILLDNRDGAELETLYINGFPQSAIKGLPRRVAVPLYDRHVIYRAIIWRKRTIKEVASGHRDYLITRTIVEKQFVPRKASEIRAIKKLLEREALDEVRKSAAKRFGKVIGGPEEDDAQAETPSAD